MPYYGVNMSIGAFLYYFVHVFVHEQTYCPYIFLFIFPCYFTYIFLFFFLDACFYVFKRLFSAFNITSHTHTLTYNPQDLENKTNKNQTPNPQLHTNPRYTWHCFASPFISTYDSILSAVHMWIYFYMLSCMTNFYFSYIFYIFFLFSLFITPIFIFHFPVLHIYYFSFLFHCVYDSILFERLDTSLNTLTHTLKTHTTPKTTHKTHKNPRSIKRLLFYSFSSFFIHYFLF